MEYLIYIAISLVVSYALAPKPPVPTPASLDDVDVPHAEQGKAIPVVFGTVWLKSPCVVWYGDLKTRAITKKGSKK